MTKYEIGSKSKLRAIIISILFYINNGNHLYKKKIDFRRESLNICTKTSSKWRPSNWYASILYYLIDTVSCLITITHLVFLNNCVKFSTSYYFIYKFITYSSNHFQSHSHWSAKSSLIIRHLYLPLFILFFMFSLLYIVLILLYY